jgi:ribosomal protein L16 Arg81 hydroxylase
MITSAKLPLVAAAGRELAAWLAPVTPETFVRDYWGRQPLYVKGFKEKYAGFFDGETFGRALTAPGPYPDDFLRASFDRKTAAGTSAVPVLPGELRSTAIRATPDQAGPLFDAGATLCVSQLETRVPHLAPFVAAIKRQLGFVGKATFNAYLSPPGSGFNWHFDGRIASTLQIEGSKVWRFTNEPAIAWPRGNGSIRADGTPQYTDPVLTQGWEQLAPFDERDVTEVLLEPGDLLILPAGIWHEACGGTGGSLALNLSFTPVSYTVLVRELLDGLLAADPAWRSPEPVLQGTEPGTVDAAGVAAIARQLQRAAAALGSLAGDSAAVVRLWQSFVQNANPGTPLPPGPPAAGGPVRPDQRLGLRRDGNVHVMPAENGTQLFVMAGTRRIELTGEAVAFVRRLLAAGEFAASDCVHWSPDGTPFAWADVENMLVQLKREGLIEERQ